MAVIPVTKHIIEQIVDRQHVGVSDRDAIKAVISRLKKGYKTWMLLDKAERKQWMKIAIDRHHANQGIYNFVMTGR